MILSRLSLLIYPSPLVTRGRFAVDLHGGRSNWDARAISRMWYGCQVAACGIPMTFMGSEMHHSGWWGVEDKGRMIDWGLAGKHKQW